MPSILAVVMFMAGTTWGPTVTMTPTSSAEAYAALRWEVVRQISAVARTNLYGGASVSKHDEELLVMAEAQGARKVAQLSCKLG